MPPTVALPEYHFHCFKYDGGEYDITLKEAFRLGYIAVSLDDYAKAEAHHERLHIDIDTCSN